MVRVESIPSPPSPTESEGTPLDSPVDQGLATSRGDSERKSSMSEASQPARFAENLHLCWLIFHVFSCLVRYVLISA